MGFRSAHENRRPSGRSRKMFHKRGTPVFIGTPSCRSVPIFPVWERLRLGEIRTLSAREPATEGIGPNEAVSIGDR